MRNEYLGSVTTVQMTEKKAGRTLKNFCIRIFTPTCPQLDSKEGQSPPKPGNARGRLTKQRNNTLEPRW